MTIFNVLLLQVILLSATMPSDVLEVTKRFMRDPIRILVKKEELTLEGIRQFYIQVGKFLYNIIALDAAQVNIKIWRSSLKECSHVAKFSTNFMISIAFVI